MKCKNHPNVDAFANCSKCDTPMCGQCANFVESETLCDRRVKSREAEQFVPAQSRKQNKTDTLAKTIRIDTKVSRKATKKKPSNTRWGWLIVLVGFGVIAYRLYSYSHSDDVPIDAVARAQDLSIDPLDRCIAIFTAIGELLQNNEMPHESLRCDASGTPNIVTRGGGDIVIAHPHPDFYGFKEIYVSKNNPVPTLVE